MNIALPHELEEFVESLVKSGAYPSAGEAVRDGLRLLQDREELRRIKLKALRGDIAEAVDASGRGEVIAGDEAFRRLRENAAARAARGAEKSAP